MNIINKDALLGIEFLSYITTNASKRCSAIEFALKSGNPIEYTYQTCRKLRKAGLLSSNRGRKGSYVVNNLALEKYSVLDYMKYFNGAASLDVVSNTPIGALISRIIRYLDTVRLKDIVEGNNNEQFFKWSS